MKHSPAAPTPQSAVKKKAFVKSAKQGNGPVYRTDAPEPPVQDALREQWIRQTAYYLYESRCCEGGHELDDWLQAEAQIAQTAPGAQHA